MTEAICRNPKSRERAVLVEMDKDSVTGLVAIPAVILFPGLTMPIKDKNDSQLTVIKAPNTLPTRTCYDIHVYATSTAIVKRYHKPRDYPYTMAIGDATFLWYDMFNSKAAVKRPLLVDYIKPCGKERAGNMNALWDRMAKNDALWECVLPKSKEKSHIFETFSCNFIYMSSLGRIKRQFDKNDFPFPCDKICSYFPETTCFIP